MTIKEAEARTGLARANIRYYEEEGFFTASRGENGYRNYSEEDIDTLLKVKLLRQLGFSLEEIHQLQNGERSLEPALERREADLEREQRELDQTIALCRDMRSDRVSFCTLDARRYLDRLERTEEVLARDRDPVRVFPWRRFFARTLDLELYTTLLALILQLTLRINLVRMVESGGRFLLSLGGLVLMAGAETVMLHLWGTTPGKALLGLKILREDGSKLSWEESARRTLRVTTFFGGSQLLSDIPFLLFPLAGLGMLLWACWQVNHQRPLFWEEDQLYLDGSTRERAFWDNRRNYLRAAGYLVAAAACVGLMVGGHLLASMPPHWGAELTVEQFVENYNRYMEFSYGKSNLRYFLTDAGTFEEIPQEGNSVVIDLSENCPVPRPAFQFTEEDGVLTGLTLAQDYESAVPLGENGWYMVTLPYEEIAVAARSLFWRSLGSDGAAELYQALTEQDGNLHWEREKFKISGETRFSGYHKFGDTELFPTDGQVQRYLVAFTIERK